jgi:hypothetical protein
MKLNIQSNMSTKQLQQEVSNARKFLTENSKNINPDIINIMSLNLDYVDTELCTIGSSLTKSSDRYNTVNQIFNLGVRSAQSVEHEKEFFTTTQRLLEYIKDKKSLLRDQCLPLAIHGEAALMSDLEQRDPSHKNAVNGIISGSLGLGLIFFMTTRNPWSFTLSLLVVAGKFIPVTNHKPSPSVLGALVYIADPIARKWTNRINDVAPVNFGYRLLNIFSKGTNSALNIAEQVVTRAECISGLQNPARLENQNHLLIEGQEQEENTSYAARRQLK